MVRRNSLSLKIFINQFQIFFLKLKAEEMILNIRHEFELTINEVDWMDKQSKQAAIEKAESIDIKIGYPEFIYNKSYIDSIYKDVIYSLIHYIF